MPWKGTGNSYSFNFSSLLCNYIQVTNVQNALYFSLTIDPFLLLINKEWFLIVIQMGRNWRRQDLTIPKSGGTKWISHKSDEALTILDVWAENV